MLVAIEPDGSRWKSGRTRFFWTCKCDCGKYASIESSHLESGMVKSCGCLKDKRIGDLNRKHNDSKSKEYKAWQHIKGRCYCKTDIKYKDYGARGIKVCDRWINSYENFLNDMGRAPSKEHSIDRIDNDGDYHPSNCRWATILEQMNNQRQTIRITRDGVTHSLRSWCSHFNLKYKSIHGMIKYKGLTFDQVLIKYGKL